MNRYRIYGLLALAAISLCLGIASFASSLAFSEWSYDRGFDHPGNIYRVELSTPELQGVTRAPITDPDLSTLLNGRLSHIDGYTAASLENGRNVRLYGTSARERVVGDAFAFDADPSILTVLGLPLRAGSLSSEGRSDSVLISDHLAVSLFGDPMSAIGQVIHPGPNRSVVVEGVFDDLPKRAHLSFDMLLPRRVQALPTVADFKAEDFGAAPTGIVAGVIDTMTYIRVPPNHVGTVTAALEDLTKTRNRVSFAGMQLVPLLDIYFSNVPTAGGKSGDRALFWGLIGVSIIFYAMAVGQLRLMVVNGQAKRLNRKYLLKSIGYTPRALLRKDIWALSGVAIILFVGVGLALLFLSAQTRTALGWSNSVVLESPIASAIIFFLALLIAIILSVSAREMAYIVAKPSGLLASKGKAGFARSLPLKIVVLINFAMATVLVCLLLAAQTQISNYRTAERGFETAEIYLIEGWRSDSVARDALDNRDRVRPVINRLRSSFGEDAVALASTDFRGTALGRETFTLENGQALRLQVIYTSANLFDVLGVELRGLSAGGEGRVRRATDVIVSQSLQDFLEVQLGGDALGRTLTHSTGTRVEIEAVVDNLVIGDPELADPKVLYITDERRAPNIMLGLAGQGRGPLAGQLAALSLNPSISAVPLADAINAAIAKKNRHRDFMMMLATFVTGTALLSAFNLFMMILRQSRKEIVIRQVYGYTFLPILQHWLPRMIWPIAAGCLIGAVLVGMMSLIVPSIAAVIANLSVLGRAAIAAFLVVIGVFSLFVCVGVMSRRIDLDALRDNTLET